MSTTQREMLIPLALALTLGLDSVPPLEAAGVSDGQSDYRKVLPEALRRWQEMRFGLFVHWGPVSLKGTEIGWSRGREVPAEQYDRLYLEFNPTKFDAGQWVLTAKAAGMKYLVITSKHHDGFCLWDSRSTDYDIMSTPFKRDILKELSNACRKHGIQFSTYYSICDWWHPDYPLGSPGGRSEKSSPNMAHYVPYLRRHVKEILDGYGPLGVMWFDGEWEKPWTQQLGNELYQHVKQVQPDVLVNNRVNKARQGMSGTTQAGIEHPGDFDTPEQRIGGFNRSRPWETCMTICNQWAWKPNDRMKSLKQCLQTLIHTVGGDGNLLLNVGPMPDGRIEPRQVERLREMGLWLQTYGKGVYGTRGGPFKPGTWGASTCKGNSVFLYVMNWPKEGPLRLPAIPRQVTTTSTLSGGQAVVNQSDAGIAVDLAESDRDPVATVLQLSLDGPALDVDPVDMASTAE